jgi:hypothetical protein
MSTGRRPYETPLRSLACLSLPSLCAALALVVACGGGNDGKPIASSEKPLPVGKDSSAVTDTKAEGGEVKAEGGEAKAEGGEAKAEGGEAKAEGGEAKAEGGEAKAEGGDAKADGGEAKAEAGDDAKAADEGKAADDTGGAAPVDPAALTKEIASTKTKDERALEALAELETAGTKLRDVAKAANTRGEKLHDDPERAKKFFEWAAAKDPKYPDPVFNLAKQLANTGEVDPTVEKLTEVKKRGGKKLLQQIDFDPMWEIVKDDPRVRELLGGG